MDRCIFCYLVIFRQNKPIVKIKQTWLNKIDSIWFQYSAKNAVHVQISNHTFKKNSVYLFLCEPRNTQNIF